jgi:MFS family permease
MTLAVGTRFETKVPSRLDRLPWSQWHWRVVVALGITWLLDGLEVTIVGSVAPMLQRADTLHLSDSQIGLTASAYLAGAILGALVFGRLTDVFGRKRLFLITLGLYLAATLATAASWSFASFAFFRALTGAGIGGEYAAINSAIDELIPARVRGRTDLAINSTYWAGTAFGSLLTLVVLNPRILPAPIGWRVVFGLGAVIGLGVMFVRRYVPESPRWLLLHGRLPDAEHVVDSIEAQIRSHQDESLPPSGPIGTLEVKGAVTFGVIAHVLFRRHLRRTVLGLTLMIAQAFAYNGIFFTYALVLTKFYDVPPPSVGLYLLPFAIGNLLGPLLLGHFFDTLGRRVMISLTYGVSGILLAITGYAMAQGWLTATTQTALWCAVFFVASAAASSAYLTVSELFPVELRGLAIAFFYAVGTAAGGLVAPALFGALLETGSRGSVLIGYLIGAALMLIASLAAALWGEQVEQKSLEMINPL